MGSIEAICSSECKGTKKTPFSHGKLVKGFGLEGDAHGGAWHRQVSLLDVADIETMRRNLPDLQFGAFAENVAVSGIDLGGLGLGSRLRLGSEAEIELTQRGKTCHSHCAIYHQTGDCIMPRRGVFAQVLVGGAVQVGDHVEVLEPVPPEMHQVAVLTVSDSCSSGEAMDTAGPNVAELVQSHLAARVYATEIVPDKGEVIAERLRHYADGPRLDLVLAVGGTGFAPRDVTPEAVRSVVDRLTPGLDEAMRAASLQITSHAMLSRAASGIRGKTLILSLPGSRRAADENLRAVLPALPHGLAKLRGDAAPCGPPRFPNQDEDDGRD
ncbi:MAG: molybdenum cofactor biosynthesis protein [Nitrospiraceae bacterium]|nr:molybdenum cofactor biosynthesis protein [Nitrospiraceae bacterium]